MVSIKLLYLYLYLLDCFCWMRIWLVTGGEYQIVVFVFIGLLLLDEEVAGDWW